MITLAIETATLQGSVALSSGIEPPRQLLFERGMVHGRDLAPSIDSLLRSRSLSPADVDLLAVDVGPGSYTGLRVGLAYAKTLAWALGKPVVGVMSLDVLAHQYARAHPELPEGSRICPAIDAKWNQVYYATYEISQGTVRRVDGPHADPPEAALTKISNARIFGDALQELIRPSTSTDPDPAFWFPLASTVLELGVLKFQAGGADNLLGLEPLYLRPTEAELKRNKT